VKIVLIKINNKMKYEEYQKLSIRTLAPLNNIYGLDLIEQSIQPFDSLYSIEGDQRTKWLSLFTKLDSVHMTLGMFSEISELRAAILNNDKVNISEELADIMWYHSGELILRNIPFTLEFSELKHKLENVNIDKLLIMLVNSISEYSDLVKKDFAYNKFYEKHFYQLHITTIFNSVANIANYFEIDMEKALQNNIDKLYKRFPDKFTEHNAINRNLDVERKELEK
jgi:NTP pyrophosphatase (non-canonical NTP hydrolase)